MYCGTCGRSLRDDEAVPSRAAGDALRCSACRPEPAAVREGRPATKSRTLPILRPAPSRGVEDPLTGILLNAALVAAGALLLVLVTPGETTTADHRDRLDAVLANIQRIRDADPTYARAAEVLSLYDEAANLAGLKRPQMDRLHELREEYCREARKSLQQ
jgi:hypothetical protein